MAEINATVITNNNSQLTLRANRKGGCANCEKSTHCSVLLLSPDKDETIAFNTLPIEGQSSGDHHAKFEQGKNISLRCDDNTLLAYISILFLPTLLSLFVMTMLVELCFGHWSQLQQIALQLTASFSLGVWISRAFLQKMLVKGPLLKLGE